MSGATPKAAGCLPPHGQVSCPACYQEPVRFDVTRAEGDSWRITANPLAWGSKRPEILVLGFSKGPTQAGALARTPHDEIAFKGARGNAYNILAHIGAVPPSVEPAWTMDRLIADRTGRLGFGSLVRCTVERRDEAKGVWLGTGGGMLDRFVATPFGAAVAGRCTTRFLGALPQETKLVVLYGLGSRLGYVDAAERLIRAARSTSGWRRHDEVSYGDDRVTFVHTEHFRSQGAYIPNWLGATDASGALRDPGRARLGRLAATAVVRALSGPKHGGF